MDDQDGRECEKITERWNRPHALPEGSGVIFAPPLMSVPQPPEPVCKAILLCEKTIVEAGSGSVSLIGVFDSFIIGDSGLTGRAEAFCQITDAEGRYDFGVQIQDLQHGTVIGEVQGYIIEIPDRLMRANVIIPVPQMPIANSGAYDFVILANGSEIDRQQFRVIRR